MDRTIDLNADIGEGCGDDAALMAVVTSVSIACGGHAGDDGSMQSALDLAHRHGVSAGAHPAYPDREGFGRRPMDLEPAALFDAVAAQVAALRRLAREAGVPLAHVKPHGALYNQAHRDAVLARTVIDAIAEALPGAALFGPPGGALAAAAETAGLPFVAEGFVDRAYRADGTLVPRGQKGAVLEDPDSQAIQAAQLVLTQGVIARDGRTMVPLAVRTLCLHGDTDGAAAAARKVRAGLEAVGVTIGVPR